MNCLARHANFQRAAEEFAAHPTSPEPIAAMMQIALEDPSPALRGWAAKWLKEQCNIAVTTDATQGQDNAASAPAESIL